MATGETLDPVVCFFYPSVCFIRLARHRHNNVLSALALDDSCATMPIVLPKADLDLAAVIDDDIFDLGIRLRRVQQSS